MRNSSSLDWLRFMHTPNDYRVSHFLVILHNINIRLNFKCMVLSQRIEHRLHDKSMALIVNEGGQTCFRGG